MSKSIHSFFIFTLSFFLLFGMANGQTKETGVIQGNVVDEDNSPLPGVSVTLSSPSLMGTRSAITDENGYFRFPAIPGGDYTVEAELEGFNPVKKTNVRLHVGMTVTLDITLRIAKLEEEITVKGEAPLVDITDSSTAKTILSKDFLENIPTSRDASDILNYAPGVVSKSAYGGGNSTSNSYQIDGVEVVDAWFGGGIYTTPIDYHVIDETQVVGLGAPAEYGNFTGAQVNIITKSGGNRFSGDVLFSYQGLNWKSENVDPDASKWSLLEESPDMMKMDASFHLGGPIIKDKLWFFTGFEYFRSKEVMESADKESPLNFPKGFLKVTYQLNENNRFQSFFQYHNRMAENIGLSPLIHKDANWDLRYPVYVGNLSYLHTFNPDTIFELKLAGYMMEWHSIPDSRDKDTPGHMDLVTGERYGNSYWWSLWKSNRLHLKGALSHYEDDFLGGTHDFKLGFEIERSSGGGDVSINGGFVYMDWNGEPYMAMKYSMNEWAVMNRYSFYAQDDWQIFDSMVMNPGLRFDVYRGSIPDLGETLYKTHSLEPRIGFTWDVFKNHRTALKAHYGKYNESTKTYYISQAEPAESDTIYYSVPEWGTLNELFRIPEENLFSVDENIKHPSMDQITVGVEQVLGEELTANVTFIHRNWDDFIEPVNVGGEFETTTHKDPETGEVYTVYNQMNPGEDHYLITNPNEEEYPEIVKLTPDRTYQALQVSLNKRMSDNWQLYASYVYSNEEGSYPNSHGFGHSFNMGRSEVFYDPNYQINLYGHSVISIPHTFKLQGTVILPLNVIVSGFYTYRSGMTWSRRIPISGLNQGAREILTESAGSRRLPDENNLDFRLEKSFFIQGNRIRFMFDVFNAFNQGRETSVQSVYGENFGKPLDVNRPRTFRASLRFMF